MKARPFFNKSYRILLAVCTIAMLLSTTSALAAAGALDPTFGTNGVVTTKFNDMPSSASEVVLQTDGKIITLGTVKLNDEQSEKIITRYHSNGTLDTSFGVNGNTLVEVDSFSGSKIALQPDGKLIVGGKNGDEFAVVRYNSNGTLDISFGTNGMGVFNLGGSDVYQSLGDIAIQSDGKIVVVGDVSASQSTRADLIFARFNSDGTKDISDVIYFSNSHNNYGKAVVIQPDGKIVLSGIITPDDGRGPLLSLARINQDGSLDKSTFGTDGRVAIPFYDFDNSHSALALQTDGKIVMVGTVFNGVNGDLAAVRFNSNGALDTTFGGTGIVITDLGNAEKTDDLVIQADGKIIVMGETKSADSLSSFLLVRYNTDGSLDAAFGANGKAITDFGSNTATNMGISIQPDNKVVVVGRGILARYDTGASNTTQTALTFNSAGAYDGWILESGENSNQGSSLDKAAKIIIVGDDARDRQYRSILSFNTISIPDDVLITSAQVRIRKQWLIGTDPFTTHGDLLLDIRSGAFNNNITFTLEDFSAIADIGASQDKFSESSLNLYTANLNNINLGLINKYGPTQFRLLFSKDDNDDLGADYIKFYSGNAAPADQPELIVTYSTSGETGNQAPVINTNGGGTTANISLPENTITVTTVTATDPDSQPLIYSISGGADAALFNINPSDGTLSFVTAPSYNVPNDAGLDHVYNVAVQASDGGLTDSQELVISIITPNPSTGAMLDPTFGSNGVVTTKINGLPSSASEVVLQYDGKIITLGTVQSQKVITRYNSNGTLDTSFGSGGSAFIGVTPFSGSKIALQPDGKLVVAGLSNGGFAVARYNSDGAVDTSFGTNGLAALDPVNTSTDIYYFVEDVTIQPDGKIVMAGSYSIGNHIEIEVVRFNSDGTRDVINSLDWGTFGSQYNYGKAVVLQPDNKIVVSGDMVSCCDSYHYISLARLDRNVQHLDRSTFGSGRGVVTAPLNYFQHSSGALALQPDGKIVLAGTILGTDWKTPQNLALARFNSDGSQDTTFGGTGIVVTDFGAQESADDLVIQASGKIIVAGTTTSAGSSDFLLIRYNSDGSLDTSFGSNGKVVTDFGNSAEAATGIVQQSDGKVIVSGTSGDNAVLVRYVTGVSGTTNTTSFKSIGAYDGWILESGEFSSQGGSLEKISNIFYVGDNDKDRQYRGILSFDTDSIPDNATITSAQVKIKKQGAVGADPFNTHGNLLLEIRKGTFSNNIALNLEDFSALADSGSTKDKFSAADSSWYTAELSAANLGLINKYGASQFRLLFSKDDNDDLGADYIKFFSGNYTTSQPELFVTYSTTGGAGNQAPVINGGPAISINIPENTMAVSAVTALDPDGQPITYSISGVDADKFSISPSTGILTFLTAPDLEAIPLGMVYRLTVQASDGTLTASQEISVTVTGVNEFAPVITSNGGGAAANISLSENTTVVTKVTATDADLPTQPLDYRTDGQGADDSKFSINESDGTLSFVTAPSYNAPDDAGLDHVYNVTVLAFDGEFATSQELVISINNPNTTTNEALDSTFGSNGVVTTKINGLPGSTLDVLLQPDGKIITLEIIKLSADQSKGVITRYNSNGSMDISFGTNGSTLIEVVSFEGSGIALQPDGKLIVGGLSADKFAVIRYNANGTLDTSFGTNGMGNVRFSGEARQSLANVIIQPDGKIVMVGDHTLAQSNFTDLFIARFNSNGAPDESFVANGFNIIDDTYFPNNRYNYGKAGAIQPDGKIVVSGNMMDNDGKNQLSLARVNQDGSLDTSAFGANGKGTALFAFSNFWNYNMALQADGKIVVLGAMGGAKDGNLVLIRCNPDSSLDTSFGGTGIVTTDFGGEEQPDDLAIQPDGKIIVEGKISDLYSSDFLLVRYNSDGSLDTSFGANGKVITDFGNRDDAATGIALQPDNKVIVVGTSGENAILARYDTGSSNTTQTTLTFNSADAYDGWILESGENSNLGGSLDKTAKVVFVGDDARDRQYRSILSFNTISIPDNALITSAQVKIKKQTEVGTDPFNTHGDLLLDVRSGAFSNNLNLTVEDFSASAATGSNQEKFTASSSNWYTANLGNINLGLVNKVGITQFRLLFSKDDNDDMGADYIKFFSSSAELSDQPQLTITYTTSSGGISMSATISSEANSSAHPPVITSNGGLATIGIDIPENTTAVTTVTANGADQQTPTYSIVGGMDSTLFSINSSTGELNFVAAPDIEIPKDAGTDNIYNVKIQASDGELAGTQDISVTVTAVNDNTPVITSTGNLSIAENTAPVTTVTATDADLPTQSLTYSIVGGADSALFTINSSTGELAFIATPNYEVPVDAGLDNIYNATVQASDGTLALTQDFIVTVTPVNDNNPVVTSNNVVSIPENVTAVTIVTAIDTDLPTQSLTYSIVGGVDSTLFNINSSTGELNFIAAPDFEIPTDAGADNIYDVTIQVSDGELSSAQVMVVTATPVNDNNPVVTSNSAISIPENVTAVTIVTATDTDLPTQSLIYSIVGGVDSTLFNINSSTGELNFIAAPDFEIPTDAGADNIYDVTIQVSDGELSSAQVMVVTATPVNDSNPVVTSNSVVSIPENVTAVTIVTATDADLPIQSLTYSIVGGTDSALFTINSSTGALTFIAARDYEIPNDSGVDNIYNVTIQASDGTLNSTQDIAVAIVPVNDNSPVFTSLNKFSIPENTKTIAALTAMDTDRPTESLTYSIIGGLDKAKFSIVSATGALTFVAAPDFKAPTDSNADNIYEVEVQVSDGTHNSTQNISVYITNVDNL